MRLTLSDLQRLIREELDHVLKAAEDSLTDKTVGREDLPTSLANGSDTSHVLDEADPDPGPFGITEEDDDTEAWGYSSRQDLPNNVKILDALKLPTGWGLSRDLMSNREGYFAIDGLYKGDSLSSAVALLEFGHSGKPSYDEWFLEDIEKGREFPWWVKVRSPSPFPNTEHLGVTTYPATREEMAAIQKQLGLRPYGYENTGFWADIPTAIKAAEALIKMREQKFKQQEA